MAKVIDDREYCSNIWDSDTGADCKAERVVDITEDCPVRDERRVALLFTRAKRGRIVQIGYLREGEVCMSSYIHFFVDELDGEMSVASGDTFGSVAGRLGLTKSALRKLIEAHAPA